MVYRKYVFFFVVILSMNYEANAKMISLEEAEKIVLEHNPDIGASEFRKEAANERVPQAEALDDPMIGVEFYNTPIDSIDVTNADDIDLKIRQNIPFPGKLRTRGDVARFDARLISQKEQTRIQDIVYDLRMTYYTLWTLDHLIEVNKNIQKNVDALVASLKISYATKKSSLDAFLKAEIDLSKLKNEAIVLSAERETHLAHLKALLGTANHESIELRDSLSKVNVRWTVDELQKIAMNERPELNVLAAQIERDNANVTSVTKNLIPDFSFGFAYKEKPLGKNVWVFEAMINVPIFFWSKNKAEIREAKLEKMASEKEEAALRLHTYHEVEEAYNAVKAANEIIASYEKDILPRAQTSRAIAQKAYEARTGNLTTFLEAERIYFELEIPYYETQGKLGKSKARLERIIGIRLEDL